jgi:hypothetical protein
MKIPLFKKRDTTRCPLLYYVFISVYCADVAAKIELIFDFLTKIS